MEDRTSLRLDSFCQEQWSLFDAWVCTRDPRISHLFIADESFLLADFGSSDCDMVMGLVKIYEHGSRLHFLFAPVMKQIQFLAYRTSSGVYLSLARFLLVL